MIPALFLSPFSLSRKKEKKERRASSDVSPRLLCGFTAQSENSVELCQVQGVPVCKRQSVLMIYGDLLLSSNNISRTASRSNVVSGDRVCYILCQIVNCKYLIQCRKALPDLHEGQHNVSFQCSVKHNCLDCLLAV